MGPNGSGKSTLSYVLAGREGYEVTARRACSIDGKDLLELAPEERAREGVFLAFQYPVEIPGVATSDVPRTALNALRRARGETELDAMQFLKLVREQGGERSASRRRHAEARGQCRLLGRREEAQRDPADGGAGAAAGDARRDR